MSLFVLKFRNKATEHAAEVFEIAKDIFNERRQLLSAKCIKTNDLRKIGVDRMDVDDDGVDENDKNYQKLSWIQCQEFCKNIKQIAAQNGISLENEITSGIGVFNYGSVKLIPKIFISYTIHIINFNFFKPLYFL